MAVDRRFCNIKGPKGQMDDNTNPESQCLALLISILPIIQPLPDAFPEQGIVYARPPNKARYSSCIEGYDC
jgi:hypothetical protein